MISAVVHVHAVDSSTWAAPDARRALALTMIVKLRGAAHVAVHTDYLIPKRERYLPFLPKVHNDLILFLNYHRKSCLKGNIV